MLKLAEKFIGKECIIYMLSSSIGDAQIVGRIAEISDGAILLEGDNPQALNAEYILRIREYPRDKKGRKKSIIAD